MASLCVSSSSLPSHLYSAVASLFFSYGLPIDESHHSFVGSFRLLSLTFEENTNLSQLVLVWDVSLIPHFYIYLGDIWNLPFRQKMKVGYYINSIYSAIQLLRGEGNNLSPMHVHSDTLPFLSESVESFAYKDHFRSIGYFLKPFLGELLKSEGQHAILVRSWVRMAAIRSLIDELFISLHHWGLKFKHLRGLPGGPVAKALHVQCWDSGHSYEFKCHN